MDSALSLALNSNRPYDSGNLGLLQNVFDNQTLVQGGGHINAVDDQSDVAVWTQVDGAISSEFLIRLDGSSSLRGELYIYKYGDSESIYQLTEFQDDGWDSSYSFRTYDDGSLRINNGDYIDGFGSAFGFAYSIDGGTTFFYTEDSENNGVIKALTYQIADGTQVATYGRLDDSNPDNDYAWATYTGEDDWILAFEASSNKDFDDGIFLIKELAAVPEPGTMILLGMSLLGFAGVARKKNS